jgi:hypothetical protein
MPMGCFESANLLLYHQTIYHCVLRVQKGHESMVRLDIIRKRAARILLRLPLKYKKSQLYDEYKIPSQGGKRETVTFGLFFFTLEISSI